MAGYSPLKITGNSTGLVQEREEFLLPDDAYPTLQNAYVWRERILRKKGYKLLGRLRRVITSASLGNINFAASPTVNGINVFSLLGLLTSEPNASVEISTTNPFTLVIGGQTLTDNSGNGTLTITPAGTITSATVFYWRGVVEFTASAPGVAVPASVSMGYFPGLPVMGIRTRELQNSANDETIVFDQKYAYVFDSAANAYKEFIGPGTTWNANGNPVSSTDFFWSTNYWVSQTPNFTTANKKLFWVTNNSGAEGTPDPIRITDGTTWVDFVPPNYGQIDATNFLVQCLSFLPFRGRLLAFNTYEGPTLAAAINYSNRIRWSTIGNPFIPFAAGPPATGSWRDDIRGQGGFLDIPTSEDIISVGFVRDNLVIYCERSTWQLRYTGRSIAPFQIEKVNSELGGEGPFSAVQFDTSLVGIGDKGIVECDSYKSQRIDIKIPDFVFKFQGGALGNNAPFRVHGIRDFINRLAFWTIPLASGYDGRLVAANRIFPNTRLVYNYENDSWALYNDSLTTLGTYQPQVNRTWLNTKVPWIRCNFPWKSNQQAAVPDIIGGNQQGFVEFLDELTTNDVSLVIQNIGGNTTTPTVIQSPNHNLTTGFVIGISGIPTGTPFDNLNGGVFGVVVLDANNFQLMLFDPITGQFSDPQLDAPAAYIGGGLINIRENFSIKSKKFNFLDEGQNIQLGYLDILMEATESDNPGAISMNIYLDYNDSLVSNTVPENEINDYSPVSNPDTFFNSVIPTTTSNLNTKGGSKFWQRVYCATRASFLTIEYTFSNAQMAGNEQTKDVQIDAQVLWIRKGGRLTQI